MKTVSGLLLHCKNKVLPGSELNLCSLGQTPTSDKVSNLPNVRILFILPTSNGQNRRLNSLGNSLSGTSTFSGMLTMTTKRVSSWAVRKVPSSNSCNLLRTPKQNVVQAAWKIIVTISSTTSPRTIWILSHRGPESILISNQKSSRRLLKPLIGLNLVNSARNRLQSTWAPKWKSSRISKIKNSVSIMTR